MTNRDLVSLLYRADWTRLSLAAEVSVTRDRDLWRSRFDDGPPLRASSGGQFGPWSAPWFAPWFGPPRGLTDEDPTVPWESRESPEEVDLGGPQPDGREWEVATEVLGTESSRFTLLIAPGRRYREQGEGHLSGCDGERSWHAVPERLDRRPLVRRSHRRLRAAAGGAAAPAVVAAYRLHPGTRRPGVPERADALRVVATPRPGIGTRRVASRRPLDRVEVAVDTELGILLRCEEILDGRPLRVTEMADVRVDPALAGDDAPFRPPGGWDAVDDSAPPITPDRTRITPNGAGWRSPSLRRAWPRAASAR